MQITIKRWISGLLLISMISASMNTAGAFFCSPVYAGEDGQSTVEEQLLPTEENMENMSVSADVPATDLQTTDVPETTPATECTVRFELSGLGDPVADQIIPVGSLVEKPADPAAEGFRFTGWYRDAGLTTPWIFEEDIVTENITLFAGWEQVSAEGPSDQPFDQGSGVSSEDEKTKAAEEMDSDESDGNNSAESYAENPDSRDQNELYADQESGALSMSRTAREEESNSEEGQNPEESQNPEGTQNPGEDLLQAGEENEVVMLTLHANREGEQFAYLSRNYSNGEWVYQETESYGTDEGRLFVPSYYNPTAYADGFIFVYWETKDGLRVDPETDFEIREDMDLYPVWQQASELGMCEIVYDANGGYFLTDGGASLHHTWKNKDEIAGGYYYPLHPEGKAFLGWALEPEGEPVDPDTIEISGNLTLYARWVEDGYTISLHAEEPGTDRNLILLFEGDTYTAETYTFRIAKGTKINYFPIVSGGVLPSVYLAGWKDAEGNHNLEDGQALCPVKNEDYYPAWQWNGNITFHANREGEAIGYFNKTYQDGNWVYEDVVTEGYYGKYRIEDWTGSVKAREGQRYVFTGWVFKNGEPIPDDRYITVTLKDAEERENLDLYAAWTEDAYVLKFHASEEDTDTRFYFEDSSEQVITQTIKRGESVKSSASIWETVNCYGMYNFTGWKTSDGTVLSSEELPDYIPAGDEEFFGQWEEMDIAESDCFITLDANGGIFGDIWKTDHTYSFMFGEYIYPTEFGRPSHQEKLAFAGWSTDPEGHNMISFPNGGVLVDESLPYLNSTLYAQWTEGYEIIFDGNGEHMMDPACFWDAVETDKARIVVTGGTLLSDIVPVLYNPHGRSFKGWASDPDGLDMVDLDTLYAEKDLILYAQWEDDFFDISYADTNEEAGPRWGSERMQFPEYPPGAPSVKVAIIDTGINTSHAFLRSRISEDSRSFIHSDPGDYEDSDLSFGHGTAIAGVIASNTPYTVKLMILQAIDGSSENLDTIDAVIQAILYAADNGADIINLSLGVSNVKLAEMPNGSLYRSQLQDAVSYAYGKGCVIVASAGNEGADIEESGEIPAGLSHVITVSAIRNSEQLELCDFSNHGTAVDFCAPGESIYSTAISNEETTSAYAYFKGTSLAASYISSAYAIAKGCQPQQTQEGLTKMLRETVETAEDSAEGEKDLYFGYGLPQVNRLKPDNRKDIHFSIEKIEQRRNNKTVSLCLYKHPDIQYSIYRKKDEESDDKAELIDVVLDQEEDYYYYTDDVTELPYVQMYIYYVVAEAQESSEIYGWSARSEDEWAFDFTDLRIYGGSCIPVGESRFFYIYEYPYSQPRYIYDYPGAEPVNPEEYTGEEIVWKTSDPEIAVADGNGNVTGLKKGTVTLSACYSDGEVIQSIDIRVNDQEDLEKCGPDVTCSVSGDTLYITGTGEMYDYCQETPMPWDEWDQEQKEQITRIVIEDGVTSIGNSAFAGLAHVECVEGMKNVKTIGDYAFYGMQLYPVELPEGLEKIGRGAFLRTHLEELNIPASVTEIVLAASDFYDNFWPKWRVNENNQVYSSQDGVLFNKDKTVLLDYPEKTTQDDIYYVPDSVQVIGEYAFGSTCISRVVLPDSVTEIGQGAFYRCWAEEIVLPDTIQKIEDYTFAGCGQLKMIQIPETVTYIGEEAFSGCYSLEEAQIPSAVKHIGPQAFNGVSFDTLLVPDLEYFGEYSFAEGSAKKVIISDGITEIPESAFYGRTIGEIEVPSSLKKIRGSAFGEQDDMHKVIYRGFPSEFDIDIESENNNAFQNAEAQYLVTGNLGDITWSAEGGEYNLFLRFEGGSEVPGFTVPSEAPWFRDKSRITSAEFAGGIAQIGDHAVYGLTNLRKVSLPAGQIQYGKDVFRICPELQTFDFREGIPESDIRVNIPYIVTLSSQEGEEVALPVPEVLLGEDRIPLREDTDYTVIYPESREAGQYTIEICFQGSYADLQPVFLPFYITDELMDGEHNKALTYISVSSAVYNGTRQIPVVSVRAGRTNLSSSQYYLSYGGTGGINAGSYRVVATGRGGRRGYVGSVTGYFEIKKAAQSLSAWAGMSTIQIGKTTNSVVSGAMGSLTYWSSDPSIASVNGYGTITGQNVGTTTITVYSSGTANYTAAQTSFYVTVTKPSVADASVTVARPAGGRFIYNSKPHEPDVTVQYDGKILTKNRDYTVSYDKNTSVGNAKITITGIGEYEGSQTVTFSIERAAQPLTVPLKPEQTTIEVGKQLSIKVSGVKGKLEYQSSDDSIATVSKDGVVTARKAGKVRIMIHAVETGNYDPGDSEVTITVRAPKSGNSQSGTSQSSGKIGKSEASQGSGKTGTSQGSGKTGTSQGSGKTSTSQSSDKTASEPESELKNPPGISYKTHVQSIGWQGYVKNGAMSGTLGRAKRLEAIRIKLYDTPYSGGIEYRTHVQSIGWQDWVKDDAVAGTSGQSKRLEAIQIRLTGEMAKYYDVYYRTHIQSFGWTGWASNGEMCGSAGYAKRLEGIRIMLVAKGTKAPGTTKNPYYVTANGGSPVSKVSGAKIGYNTHVQTYGWQNYSYDGGMAGTQGQAKRLEGIHINLIDRPYDSKTRKAYTGSIVYRTHVQTYGWQPWKKNGQMSGTSGKAKRLEGIQIYLTGEMAKHYDIYYCVHAQTYGWLDWAKNGQMAGTSGLAKRLEGIKIKLVPKGGKAPGSTKRPNVVGGGGKLPDNPYKE